ncbi:LVIS_2131 family protein [Nicoliella spurrieriana]|uniref:LVIS_2131 family protein n=1 Tax=Nicoliella spurrieriana TaxID=2925830 RepID=A0A976RQZ6_9LACO|nr:LVIS_2131 family protein [Nicoliella spurrieriana]UQS86285.1 LVIS_2131 family protein [Nicoliella spurrieriana]
MASAWNLIGLLMWIVILIDLIWMIISIKKRNRRALLNQDGKSKQHHLMILIGQGTFLLVALVLMGSVYLNPSRAVSNVSIMKNYKPIVLDTNGRQSYYVNVYDSKNRLAKHDYTYLTKGERYRVPSNESIIVAGNDKVAYPMETYHSNFNRMKSLDQKYQKAWIETINAKYRPGLVNGLGMRVGHRASYYVIIRVPDHSFIYYH